MRLRRRLPELEQAIMTRISASAPIDENADPEYLHGLRSAIKAALDYNLLIVETGEREPPPVPLPLLMQARLAARHGVPIGTVLRRYTLGCNQLSDFIAEEAGRDRGFGTKHLRQVLRELTTDFERILEELEVEYAREPKQSSGSSEARLAERIGRCLTGELVDLSDLNYNLENHHIGAVAEGDSVADALREAAKEVNGRLLLVRPRQNVVWAWVGTKERPNLAPFYDWIRSRWPRRLPVALGEPGEGRAGWTLTHQQALEAFPFVLRERRNVIRYSEVTLKAAVNRDMVASATLRQLHGRLEQRGNDGAKLRATLRAYLNAGGNGASAAAELGLTRQTVSNHLRKLEQQLGRPLTTNAADVELALWLGESERF